MAEVKICAMLQLRNCSKSIGYLLMMISEFVDDIVVLDHASKDETALVARSFPKVRTVLIEHEMNWANVEMKNKQRLLEQTKTYLPNYLFWIDSDELPSVKFGKELRKLIKENPDCVLFGFPEVNLWNDYSTYRKDSRWFPAWSHRIIKNCLTLYYPQIEGLGHTMIPEGREKGDTILYPGSVILHYGYMRKQDRQEKYNRNMREDKGPWVRKYQKYKYILDEKDIELKETDKLWF